LVWIVFVSVLVMIIVHIFRRSLCVSLCLDLIVFVHTLSLSKAVDLTADKAGKKLLGETVADNFAYGLLEYCYVCV